MYPAMAGSAIVLPPHTGRSGCCKRLLPALTVVVHIAFGARSPCCAAPCSAIPHAQQALDKHTGLLQEPTHEPPRSPQPDKPKQTLAAKQQPYDRLFNFSAGPAVLPLPVLERAQAELLNYQVQFPTVLPAAAALEYWFCRCTAQAVRDKLTRALRNRSSPHALHVLQGSGSSVMEMSHRGKEITSIINKAEADLRQLLSIPDNYEV